MSSAPSTSASATISADADLKATVFQRLHPRAYLERFLAEGVRPDGRELSLDEQADDGMLGWRDVSVNAGSISTADGSALVRLGNTTIVCGVKAEIAEPELDRPNEGFLVPNIDLPAMCSPKFKPGPPTEEAQLLSERLNDVLTTCDVVPLSSLCIEPGKAVWVLYVDATCINYDGNAFDAALIAMVAALKNTVLPDAQYDEDRGITLCSNENRHPLKLAKSPVAISFGIFDGTHILPDPTAFEEPLLDTTVTVVLDETGNIVSASNYGPSAVNDTGDALLGCISPAQQRHVQLKNQISL